MRFRLRQDGRKTDFPCEPMAYWPIKLAAGLGPYDVVNPDNGKLLLEYDGAKWFCYCNHCLEKRGEPSRHSWFPGLEQFEDLRNG